MDNWDELRLGRYEIRQELGRGLHSTVYLAQDPEIERTVILKLLGKGVCGAELANRVRTISGLSNEGIAKIFDLGYTEPAGDPFIVMEFVEGVPLETALGRGKLPEPEALALTLELLEVLAYAHAHGVCHHNLKPSNLIVSADDRLKVTDFSTVLRNDVTPFIAPERLKANGDERSDLFSVGVILYLMLSGFRPFQGNTDATIGFKLVHQHPVPVAAMDLELTPELDLVIGRLLAKNPDERYQSAEEASAEIRRIAEGRQTDSGISQGDPLARTASLIDTMAVRTEPSIVPDLSRTAITKTTSSTLLHIGVPLVIALTVVVGLTATRLLVRPVPAAPDFSVHLTVPPPTVEVRPVPANPMRVTGRRARGDVTSASINKPGMVAVAIELRQPFRACLMSIWVDERLTYKNRIQGEKKNRFLHMGTSNSEYLTLVSIPDGNHSVRVELDGIGDSYQGSGSVAATFSKTSNKKLRITALKSRPQLELELN